MPLRATIDATKNWSGALNRLGFGFLAFFIISATFNGSIIERYEAISSNGFSIRSIFLVVLISVTSMVLGGVVISIGNFALVRFSFSARGVASKFSEIEKIRRAYRVGKSQNGLLAEILRDGTNKFDIAAGLLGLVFIFFLIVIISAILGTIPGGASSESSGWGRAASALLTYPIISVISYSATNTITALDKILDEYFPEESNKRSK